MTLLIIKVKSKSHTTSPSFCSASSLALPSLGTTQTFDQGTFNDYGSSTITLMPLPLHMLFSFLRSLSSHSCSPFCPAAPHAQEVTSSLNFTGGFPAPNCRWGGAACRDSIPGNHVFSFWFESLVIFLLVISDKIPVTHLPFFYISSPCASRYFFQIHMVKSLEFL